MNQPASPAPRTATVRESLTAALRGEALTARELSTLVGVRERDVAEHLEHLAHSLEPRGEELRVDPATCVECGYVFRTRERLSRPSACPSCRSTRIDPPAFTIVSRAR